MTYQEIKSFINTYIVQNGVGGITGSLLNTALNALTDYYGFDAVTVETLPAGSDATVNVQGRTLELGIPKGADGENGRDGLDATNPFKGWFNSLADLKASYTASVGDSAYIKDASPATTWSIYVYDSTASSDNYWGDSGIDADTSPVQTFASGEEVNQVAIDDTHLDNPIAGSLAKASDIKTELDKINDDIMNIIETNTPITSENYLNHYYIDGNIKCQSGGNSSPYKLYYKYIDEAFVLSYKVINTTVLSQQIRIAVFDSQPAMLVQGTQIIAGTAAAQGKFSFPAGKYLAWVVYDDTHKAEVNTYSKTYDGYKEILSNQDVEGIAEDVVSEAVSPFGIGISTNERALEMKQLADKTSSIVVDWMKVCHAKEGLNYVGLMDIVSSTEDTITLSTTDAAHFVGNENGHCAVCVRFSDGMVKVVYFDPYSGNDGVVSRSIYDTTDLTDAVNVQSLHDTVKNGYGIHLSQLGYIMLGQYTAQEVLKVENQRDENLVKGVCFNNLATDEYHPYLDNGKLYGKFGEYICDVSATTNVGISATAGILGDWYLNRCMTLRSATSSGNGTLTIPLSARGYFVISCMSKNTTIYSSVPLKMKLYIDGSDTPSQTFDVPVNAVQFYTSNYIDVRKELKVVFDSNGVDSFVAAIADFGFMRFAPEILAPIICTETVNTPQTLIQRQTTMAVLGDSWTQFPHITDGLAEYSDYNEKVTSPDITESSQNYHDGFGYFPKELAYRLGASVDNYGKSGMRSDNWGLVKIDEILSIKHYDYLVVEFFINDTIQKLKPDQWAYNIWLICQKCKAAGTRPVIILACEDNGPAFVGYGNRRAQFLFGLGAATFLV